MNESKVIEKIDQLLVYVRQADCDTEVALEQLRALRNLCSVDQKYQQIVAAHEMLNEFLHSLLFEFWTSVAADREKLQLVCWQLLCNSIVNNSTTQTLVWERHGVAILNSAVSVSKTTNMALMIIYNIYINPAVQLCSEEEILLCIVRVWKAINDQQFTENMDFLDFLFTEFLVKNGRTTVRCYMRLESTDRVAFLDYLRIYVQSGDPNGIVHNFLLTHISKEFKMKSDCILRQSTSAVDKLQPREVYALLRVIASASGSEVYVELYAKDHALFLNVSSLLRCLVAAGKEDTPNVFTPMNKLEEVAPASTMVSGFEAEISYQLKTLLVRCIANLLYNNKTNQQYCLDTQLMPTLLECTNMDARNPLVKEWTILAIRNACVGCPEIQAIIANLTSEGPAKNDVLSELSLDMGALRIKPSQE